LPLPADATQAKNNKGGSRINIILRRPWLADILLASTFA
jgi:hypothetical protein